MFKSFSKLFQFVSAKSPSRLLKSHSKKLVIGAVLGGGGCVYSYFNHSNKVYAAQRSSIDTSSFMEKPISNLEHMQKNPDDMKTRMELLIFRIQGELCRALEEKDGEAKFLVEKWDRKMGGGGVTCALQDSEVFEKAGVNVSVINGALPDIVLKQMRTKFKDFADNEGQLTFFVAGISSIVHPRNPHIPSFHFNFRYFEVLDHETDKVIWWFGGGSDLTPYILHEEDAIHFHQTLKSACDKSDLSYYPKFKVWCDKYFYIPFRGEARGVGGIFFDDLDSPNKEHCFQFVKDCAESMIPSYLPMIQNHKNDLYTYKDRQFQLVRRGRYVEFNLVYDRGTKFGLVTPEARVESILMSMPLLARWEYQYKTKPGSKEDKLMEILRKPRQWV